jgi:hypothetical protein
MRCALVPKNFGGYGAIVFATLVVAGLATSPAVTLVLVVYFTPLIITMSRNSPHSARLMAHNLFLGWTLIGWVAPFCAWGGAPRNARKPLFSELFALLTQPTG